MACIMHEATSAASSRHCWSMITTSSFVSFVFVNIGMFCTPIQLKHKLFTHHLVRQTIGAPVRFVISQRCWVSPVAWKLSALSVWGRGAGEGGGGTSHAASWRDGGGVGRQARWQRQRLALFNTSVCPETETEGQRQVLLCTSVKFRNVERDREREGGGGGGIGAEGGGVTDRQA